MSTNDYTNDDKTAVGKINLETLAALSGTEVTVAPWTQSVWSVAGACTLTATGWAGTGLQKSIIFIDFDSGATLSVVGAAVAVKDAVAVAGKYTCFLVNENGTVRFKTSDFEAAE